MKAVFFVAFSLACGGRIDDGDGGTTGGPDSSTQNDSPASSDVTTTLPDASVKPKCKLGSGSGSVSSNGSCSSTQDWTCGEIDFSVTCICPDAVCTCQGGNPATIPAGSTCPSCDVMNNVDQLAALCGYPTP